METKKPPGPNNNSTEIGDSFIYASNNGDSYQYSSNKQDFYTTVKQLDDEVDQKFAEIKMSMVKRDKNNFLKLCVFGLSGILGCFLWGLIYAEMNIFARIFYTKSFSFYVFIPAYIHVPLSFLINKIMSSLNTDYGCRVYISAIMTLFCLFMIPLTLFHTSNTYLCKKRSLKRD